MQHQCKYHTHFQIGFQSCSGENEDNRVGSSKVGNSTFPLSDSVPSGVADSSTSVAEDVTVVKLGSFFKRACGL